MDKHFNSLIKPILDRRSPKRLLEIGVCEGATTLPLLRWCKSNGAVLTSLDPVAWKGELPEAVKPAYKEYVFKYGDTAQLPEIDAPYLEAAFKEGLFDCWDCQKITSLDYLSIGTNRFDAVFIDGDHNYFTVLSELKAVSSRLDERGMIFLHDVADKWSRADQYYDPRAIPKEFLNGKKQGILTAVEDFLSWAGGRKEGSLALAEELFHWLSQHPADGIPARIKGALRVLLRGSDNVWLQGQHLNFQKTLAKSGPKHTEQESFVFNILSSEHFGLGLIERVPAE